MGRTPESFTQEEREKRSRLRRAQKLCGARNRGNGKPCINIAMANGRCRMHGGVVGAQLIHGLYSNRAKAGEPLPTISDRVKELKNDPNLLDGRNHIALLVATMEELMRKVEGLDYDDRAFNKTIQDINSCVNTCSQAIERYHKQSVGYYVSIEKLQLMAKMVIGVVTRVIDSLPLEYAQRNKAKKKIAERIGSLQIPD